MSGVAFAQREQAESVKELVAALVESVVQDFAELRRAGLWRRSPSEINGWKRLGRLDGRSGFIFENGLGKRLRVSKAVDLIWAVCVQDLQIIWLYSGLAATCLQVDFTLPQFWKAAVRLSKDTGRRQRRFNGLTREKIEELSLDEGRASNGD